MNVCTGEDPSPASVGPEAVGLLSAAKKKMAADRLSERVVPEPSCAVLIAAP
jgi:hypothetical protein